MKMARMKRMRMRMNLTLVQNKSEWKRTYLEGNGASPYHFEDDSGNRTRCATMLGELQRAGDALPTTKNWIG